MVLVVTLKSWPSDGHFIDIERSLGMMTHFGKSPPKDLLAKVCKLCLPSRALEKITCNFIDYPIYPSHSNMELMI